MLNSLGMAQNFGVICKGCGKGIDLGDEYILPGGKKIEFTNMAWREQLTCAMCGKTFEYKGDDLVLHNG